MASRVDKMATALSLPTTTKPSIIWRTWLRIARANPRIWRS